MKEVMSADVKLTSYIGDCCGMGVHRSVLDMYGTGDGFMLEAKVEGQPSLFDWVIEGLPDVSPYSKKYKLVLYEVEE